MDNQDFSIDIPQIHINSKGETKKKNKIIFDNYITPYWYGNLIDSKSKIENLKNLYEAFRSGYISLEDFNQSITELNDNRPIAQSI